MTALLPRHGSRRGVLERLAAFLAIRGGDSDPEALLARAGATAGS